MTEPTPTDAEINALAEAYLLRMFSSRIVFNGTMIDFARDVLAKWGTPQAVAGGEPVAWLSVDCIGERYLCFTRPDDDDPVRPLVFGDTAPSVLEDAARYRHIRDVPHSEEVRSVLSLQQNAVMDKVIDKDRAAMAAKKGEAT